MFKFFDFDSPIMQWLQKIATVLFCGFFWILCSIPVITVGASTTAMFRMMFNIREDKNASVREFFRVFGKEFGKSTLLWLLQLLTAVLLVLFSFWIGGLGMEGIVQLLSVALIFILIFFWMLTFAFVYPLTAYFENTVLKTVANGLLMGIGNRFQSIPILALTMLPLLIAIGTLKISWELFYYVFVMILPLWFFVFLPLLVYVQSGLFLQVFEKYIEPETIADKSPESESAIEENAAKEISETIDSNCN